MGTFAVLFHSNALLGGGMSHPLFQRSGLMSGRWMILVVVACGCGWPGIAWGVIDSNTNYTLDLTQSKEAGAKATWSDAK